MFIDNDEWILLIIKQLMNVPFNSGLIPSVGLT
jgi:hypothetical protein